MKLISHLSPELDKNIEKGYSDILKKVYIEISELSDMYKRDLFIVNKDVSEICKRSANKAKYRSTDKEKRNVIKY